LLKTIKSTWQVLKKTGRKPNHIDRDRLGNKAEFICAALLVKNRWRKEQFNLTLGHKYVFYIKYVF